ncbi:TrmH family RNA methyltransferase [Stieleria varia]|uniref:Putative TrmH family tRNA/rRNA methyltransferase n=1 Tax=Stieleria varia TaxID=2528005 RepID=A0A5C6B3I2_9BACT|nr:RNA methyltransferase [Stieleria varia]TWU06460.1 putative TrmH family tRNA/rRNA methyltransferase [Stieleria varia]
MPLIPIERPDDPRLQPFRDLQHRGRNGEIAATDQLFVVEGKFLTERLIRSDHELHSIVIETGRELDALKDVPDSVPVFQIPSKAIRELVGFDFHRGVLASGIRKPFHSIDELHLPDSDSSEVRLLLAAIGISDKENLGSMLRTAAALGVNEIILGPGTVDPYSRRVMRVSMGTALVHRFYELSEPEGSLQSLIGRGFRVVASTLDSDAASIQTWRPDDRPVVLMVGNEANGLPDRWQQSASDRVRIPMKQSTDSLNVAVAAAILMHTCTQSSRKHKSKSIE